MSISCTPSRNSGERHIAPPVLSGIFIQGHIRIQHNDRLHFNGLLDRSKLVSGKWYKSSTDCNLLPLNHNVCSCRLFTKAFCGINWILLPATAILFMTGVWFEKSVKWNSFAQFKPMYSKLSGKVAVSNLPWWFALPMFTCVSATSCLTLNMAVTSLSRLCQNSMYLKRLAANPKLWGKCEIELSLASSLSRFPLLSNYPSSI